jgi:hypothetical protein
VGCGAVSGDISGLVHHCDGENGRTSRKMCETEKGAG